MTATRVIQPQRCVLAADTPERRLESLPSVFAEYSSAAPHDRRFLRPLVFQVDVKVSGIHVRWREPSLPSQRSSQSH